MASTEVTSLNKNIPIINTLNITKDRFTRKTTIIQHKFVDLLNLVLTTTRHTFNSQFYQLTNGTAMEGPATSTTAEIYMQAHEKTAISMSLIHSKSLGTICG